MKKVLTTAVALIFLTGCMPKQEVSVPSTEPSPTQLVTEPADTVPLPTQEQTEPVPDIPQLAMIAVNLPLHTDTLTNDSGVTLYHQSTQSMQLTMRDPEVADAIILDFLNRVDSHSDAAEAVRQSALSADTSAPYWSEYLYDLVYAPMRLDHSVLSLYGEAISYAGESHPQRLCTAANYNIISGEVLTLGSILYHLDSKDDLADLVIESLDMVADEKYLLDGYDDVVYKRFARDESFDEDWYFSDDGLYFFFAPYEIAPYSSGVITAEIPYSRLTGIIADEFFPAEEDLCQGEILATHMDSSDTEQFSQITEVTVHQDGEMFFLYTAEMVRNLQIHKRMVSEDAYGYTKNTTIFRTYTLTPGDAVMVKLSVTNSENLFITYESGGVLHQTELTSDFLNP